MSKSRKQKPDDDDAESNLSDAGEDSDSSSTPEGEYKVDRILQKKPTKGGKAIKYLVKWEGYDEDEATWEPAENLSNCPEKIEAYEKEHAAKETKPPSSMQRKRPADRSESSSNAPKRSSSIVSSASGGSAPTTAVFKAKRTGGVPSSQTKPSARDRSPSSDDQRHQPNDQVEVSPATKSGFELGLEAEEIVGATDHPGELTFYVKFRGKSDPDFVSAKIANVRIPQLVIKYYESHLTWKKA